MDFRILGPLEVLDAGRTVDIGAAKERALLAALLLNRNRVVSSDRLIDALWGERAPGTAQKALQVYISHLRKALGRDRILTRAPGYELRVEAGELDLERFELLVANQEFAEALRLKRGTPLAEFAYEPFAQSEIARLEELALACLEQRLDVELAEGHHAALVAELEALVAEHPLRERLRAQLMLALYRSGRQAEALDAYQAGRTLLSDELGLEPGADLKELQRAILEQDPRLASPQPSPPEPLSRRADASGAPTMSSSAPAREVRKTVTVLFCDVTAVGSQLDPESLRNLTARGFDELLPVLERHGATVERSLGGAAAAIFGIPVVHEDDALRAVRAATEMRERLAALHQELEDQWGAYLALRIGIGTGEVVAGGEPFAIGEPVQSALGLQREARPDELLVDERTHQLVRDAVNVETSDGRVRVAGLRAIPAGYGPVRGFDSPMVGRERERRRLDDAFEQAVIDRSCQLFTILGAAGMGKSRLVQEFVSGVAADALVARGRCLPYGEGITYWPVLEAVRDATRLDDAASSEDNLRQLAALLDSEEDGAVAARRLGEVLGLVEHTSSAEETFRAVRTFVEALARRRPLVLVFDDIHWGEATFLDLVDHVSDWVRAAPVLLVCMARTELLDVRPQWGGGKLNATSVLLEPLSDADSVKLLDNLARSADLDEPARQRIVETSGGNPLFVEEMLALLLEDGRDRATFEVPATIQALLAARLDRLPDKERAAIEAASVEGKVFHEASVAELCVAGIADVHEALLELVRRDMIRQDRPVFSGERAYHFRHLLIRDAAYESIPKEARATLHERHARLLEARFGDRTIELDEIVGYHYEQAFQYRAELGSIDDQTRVLGRAAAERLGTAGRRAFVRSDVPAGVNLVSRAVALLGADDPLRVELVPNVRVVQGMSELSELSWADRVLTEAVEAAATTGDRRLASHALVQRGLLRLFTEADVTSQEILRTARQAIDAFEVLGDELGLARAWRLAAQGHYLARAAEPSAEAAERALEHARRAGDRFEQVEVVEWLLVVLLFGPCPAAEGSDRCRRLLRDVAGQPELEARVAVAVAWFEAAQGHVEPTRELLAEARRAMDDHGEVIGQVMFYGASALMLVDDRAEAEEVLHVGYDTLRAMGRTGHYGAIALRLAQLSYARGGLEDAEKYLEEVAECLRPNDVWDQSHWRAERAKILAQRGEFAAGEALVREAAAFAATSDFLTAQADAMLDVGEVLRLASRREDAVAAIVDAVELYEQKGNVLAAGQARDLLRDLQRGERSGD